MFSWKNLQTELSRSPWLMPEDDITTQRGIVAASIAILDRMSNGERLREVTWTPVRRLTPPEPPRPAPTEATGEPFAKVPTPTPPPRTPRPGGAAVKIPE